ncbi:class I SAM-dependent methyltransferase [Salinithrix halophila]|uniref:Class I SAM-dependent methyltransferase n=1 Tax=Salinithrix halophila TaxID=1485204 RepID=A0ABV8JGN6_9BACL
MLNWNEVYQQGNMLWDTGSPSPELVATMMNQGLPQPGDTALDIGCGGGWESIFLAECGYQVLGIDLAPEAIKLAKQRAKEAGVQVDFRQGNALQLPVEDETIDFITDRGCLHIIPEKDQPTYVNEVTRVLKPGGVFLLRGISQLDETMLARMKEEMPEIEDLAGDLPDEPLSKEKIERLFRGPRFTLSRIFPFKMGGKDLFIQANMVLIRKQ